MFFIIHRTRSYVEAQLCLGLIPTLPGSDPRVAQEISIFLTIETRLWLDQISKLHKISIFSQSTSSDISQATCWQ
jgi:hypothetical protein